MKLEVLSGATCGNFTLFVEKYLIKCLTLWINRKNICSDCWICVLLSDSRPKHFKEKFQTFSRWSLRKFSWQQLARLGVFQLSLCVEAPGFHLKTFLCFYPKNLWIPLKDVGTTGSFPRLLSRNLKIKNSCGPVIACLHKARQTPILIKGDMPKMRQIFIVGTRIFHIWQRQDYFLIS